MDASVIPQEKTAAVTRALREALDATAFDDIKQLNGGLFGAFVYRIVVEDRPYLLRVILRDEDPTRHFTCMRAAAEAGLAPRALYTSVEDKVCLTEFIEPQPFQLSDALVRMPAALRALHTLPPFPTAPFNTTCTFLLGRNPALEDFIQKVRAAAPLPKDEMDELFALYQRVTAAYPSHDPDRVSCHNDLFKSDNVVFDGSQVWLVDWEAAFLNDRYADLAVVANYVVSNDGEEEIFLSEYFGRPPDEYQRARFFLMQQLVHTFYAMVYLWLGSPGGPIGGDPAPDLQDMHRRIWTNEIHLGDNQTKTLYGRAHWRQLRKNMRQARFDGAARIVSGCAHSEVNT
jgi:aminoglycoside phosphotransferase (APT) family kinase protein